MVLLFFSSSIYHFIFFFLPSFYFSFFHFSFLFSLLIYFCLLIHTSSFRSSLSTQHFIYLLIFPSTNPSIFLSIPFFLDICIYFPVNPSSTGLLYFFFCHHPVIYFCLFQQSFFFFSFIH